MILSIVFITGLIIFLYPIVSNYLNTKEHYSVMSEHNAMLEKMTNEQKNEEREKAKQYNESINGASIPMEDPFAGDVTESTVTGYVDALDIGESMGSIEIPRIDTQLPIYHGVGEEVLQQGVGHMSNSSLPIGGAGSHTALTAHRGLPSSKLFTDLDKVQLDDVFYIHTLGDTLAYQVDDIQVVLPHEMDWLRIEESKDYVTLITCEPYMINTHRLLVRGERIEGPEAVEATANQINGSLPKQANSQWMNIASFMTGVLLLLLMVIFLYRWKFRKE